MAHDIVIRNGDIVDGTGAEPVPGDLAIDDGVISAVGNVEGKGNEEIYAEINRNGRCRRSCGNPGFR